MIVVIELYQNVLYLLDEPRTVLNRKKSIIKWNSYLQKRINGWEKEEWCVWEREGDRKKLLQERESVRGRVIRGWSTTGRRTMQKPELTAMLLDACTGSTKPQEPYPSLYFQVIAETQLTYAGTLYVVLLI